MTNSRRRDEHKWPTAGGTSRYFHIFRSRIHPLSIPKLDTPTCDLWEKGHVYASSINLAPGLLSATVIYTQIPSAQIIWLERTSSEPFDLLFKAYSRLSKPRSPPSKNGIHVALLREAFRVVASRSAPSEPSKPAPAFLNDGACGLLLLLQCLQRKRKKYREMFSSNRQMFILMSNSVIFNVETPSRRYLHLCCNIHINI